MNTQSLFSHEVLILLQGIGLYVGLPTLLLLFLSYVRDRKDKHSSTQVEKPRNSFKKPNR